MNNNLKVLIGLAAKRYCQQVLVLFLREYFSKEGIDSLFRWNANPAKTKILISSEYPESLMKVPSVIVGDITGDMYNRVLGQEMIWEHKTEKIIKGVPRMVVDKVTTHGTYSLGCDINVHSYKVSTRRFVADLVAAAIRHIGIDELKKAGITINKCALGSTRYQPVGNSMLQVSPINIGFITEWHKDATDLETLEQILIKEINVSSTEA